MGFFIVYILLQSSLNSTILQITEFQWLILEQIGPNSKGTTIQLLKPTPAYMLVFTLKRNNTMHYTTRALISSTIFIDFFSTSKNKY